MFSIHLCTHYFIAWRPTEVGTFIPGWRFADPGLLYVTLSGLMEFYFLNNCIFRMGKQVAHPTELIVIRDS